MTYKALVYFEDLKDNRHPYSVGDFFPRAGYEPSAERIAELCSTNNKRGKAVIEPVKQEEPFPMNEPVVVETVAQEESVKPKRGRKRKETY